MVRCDALLLLETSKPSSAGREDCFCWKVFLCVWGRGGGWGADMGKVSKRKDIFALICKVSESEHTID